MYTLKLEVHPEGCSFTAINKDGELMSQYAISPEHTDLLLELIGELLNKISPVLGGKLYFVDVDDIKKKKKKKGKK